VHKKLQGFRHTFAWSRQTKLTFGGVDLRLLKFDFSKLCAKNRQGKARASSTSGLFEIPPTDVKSLQNYLMIL